MSFAIDKPRLLRVQPERRCAVPIPCPGKISFVPCGYKAANTPLSEGRRAYVPGMCFGGVDQHGWFRFALGGSAAPAHARAFLRVSISGR